MKQIQLEILLGSYQEHFKKRKDLTLIYPIGHPKLLELEIELNKISDKQKNMDK